MTHLPPLEPALDPHPQPLIPPRPIRAIQQTGANRILLFLARDNLARLRDELVGDVRRVRACARRVRVGRVPLDELGLLVALFHDEGLARWAGLAPSRRAAVRTRLGVHVHGIPARPACPPGRLAPRCIRLVHHVRRLGVSILVKELPCDLVARRGRGGGAGGVTGRGGPVWRCERGVCHDGRDDCGAQRDEVG